MVLFKDTAAWVVLLFLCSAWLSTARFNPKGAAVNEIPDIKASVATRVTKSTTVKSLAAITEGNLSKASMSKSGKVKSSTAEAKRNARKRLSYKVNGGPLTFTADYYRPVHHPPKNNK
ncbi:unnamed protein product [Sphenostylis stenocarpa]|uniref:Uncharacterized protein n=1 Tax=Sphenostylis stenocarpa TaxID=92480 RepID=A0AA86S8P2_9FABA|nr:unnamed protein product [Sphenostylis stenocarpa]